jgi:siderophore synthetase component
VLLTRPALDVDDATTIALLNCLVREICAPEHQIWQSDGHLTVRLPRVGITMRAKLLRPPFGPTFRLAPPVAELRADEWIPVPWARLADLIAGELELATGRPNPEFTDQVAASRAAMAAIAHHRGARAPLINCKITAEYVASEQALVAGHRFHPAPKARQGEPADWLRYAPEVKASFPLHWLAVRSDLVTGEGDFTLPGPPVPGGFAALPAHPWQLSLLADRPVLRAALDSGAIRDLGPAGPPAVPTSSVRTVYLPDADLFCKFSLDVRITNCVRKNAWYELTGAVALTRLLRPVFAVLNQTYGCALLNEPAYRSVTLADRRLHEGLGVIVREGVREYTGTPLLAAALADPYGCSSAALCRLLADSSAEYALTWWDVYVRRVAPPVLHAYLTYGVVLEPHLQNVLVVLDQNGLPSQAIFRDLEGAKLVPHLWGGALDDLPPHVREAMTYDADRGWNRVVYCLFVNHLVEIAGAIADLHPELERELWQRAHRHIERYAHDHVNDREGTARLNALLAGVPLPGKANLRTRWERAADRRATYIAIPIP